ncbi:MAG: chemotaxis protein CheW [Elusimicrobia bacterium]|nr:chemotaxis protein CheW [Elusimicrobiota bacterium]
MTEQRKGEAEKNREILRRRAAAMAANVEAPRAAADRYLEFSLAGERYAVDLALVREVCSGRRITAIPGSPPFMAGVANIRGQLLPVADLARLFGMSPQAAGEKIVVLRAAAARGGPAELGILAETVLGVADIPPGAIQPAPQGFSGIFGQYLGGVTASGLIIFLADRFLGDEKIMRRQETEQGSY